MQLKINPELQALIPPLSDEEKAQLEANLVADGCRDPLVSWNGVIIDGHNRFEICERLDIAYEVEHIEFDDIGAVKDWMERNQLGRRNLTPDWQRLIRGRIYNRTKKTAGGTGANQHKQLDQNEPTADRVARETGVSASTIKREGRFAAEVDKDEEMQSAMREEGTIKNVKKKRRKDYIDQQIRDIEEGLVALPEGQFEVIAMDPPWPYGREYDPESSRVANPYPEMSIEDIAAIDVPAAEDCVMFLWTTQQFIFDAKALLDGWGFTYKATMVWDKEKMGMGHWLRMQCEFCLLGIKGKPTWCNTKYRDIIREPRREHSRKPNAFYEIVEEITVGRRMEYFSRSQRYGWEVVGNDTTQF